MQVVTLRTDVLLRSLGPLAGLLQKALLPVAVPPLGPPPPPPEPSMKSLPAPSQPVPVKGPMMKPRTCVDPSSGLHLPCLVHFNQLSDSVLVSQFCRRFVSAISFILGILLQLGG